MYATITVQWTNLKPHYLSQQSFKYILQMYRSYLGPSKIVIAAEMWTQTAEM